MTHKIVKTPGIVGGRARLANSRMPVWQLVQWKKSGIKNHEVLDKFNWMNQADIDAALEYATLNKEEIDQDIKDNS